MREFWSGRMFKVLGLMLVGIAVASAATLPSASLTWVAPSLNTDGTAIVGTITYNVYAATGGAAYAVIASNVATPSYTDARSTLTDGTTVCYEVSAVVGTVESAVSSPACKTFPPGTPASPATLVVK